MNLINLCNNNFHKVFFFIIFPYKRSIKAYGINIYVIKVILYVLTHKHKNIEFLSCVSLTEKT